MDNKLISKFVIKMHEYARMCVDTSLNVCQVKTYIALNMFAKSRPTLLRHERDKSVALTCLLF